MSDNVMSSGVFPHQIGTGVNSAPVLSGQSPLFEMAEPSEETIISPNNAQFHQKPKVLGARSDWTPPVVPKYAASEVADVPAAGKVHTTAVHRIERNWGKDIVTECLMEFVAKTWWSLALETRLDVLAFLTKHNHTYAMILLRQTYAERRAKEAALGGEYLSATFTTIPKNVGKQPKAKVVETVIKEYRNGLTLEDVNSVIEMLEHSNKKTRFAKAPGENKKEMNARVKKESRRGKKDVLRTMRSVVSRPELADAPRKRIFQAVEKEMKTSFSRALRKGERKEVTKITKSLTVAGDSRLQYSLAASGPAGDIVMVRGLQNLPKVNLANEKKNQELQAKPGLCDVGQEFLAKRKYREIANATVIAAERRNGNDLDTMGDGEPSQPGGSGLADKRRSLHLSTIMRAVSVSPIETEADETMANTSGD